MVQLPLYILSAFLVGREPKNPDLFLIKKTEIQTETISARTRQQGMSEIVKHVGREKQAPQANSVPSAGSPWGCGTTKTPALPQPEPLMRHQQTAWKSRKQDLIQSVTAAQYCLSRDARQAANNILLVSAVYQIGAIKDRA